MRAVGSGLRGVTLPPLGEWTRGAPAQADASQSSRRVSRSRDRRTLAGRVCSRHSVMTVGVAVPRVKRLINWRERSTSRPEQATAALEWTGVRTVPPGAVMDTVISVGLLGTQSSRAAAAKLAAWVAQRCGVERTGPGLR